MTRYLRPLLLALASALILPACTVTHNDNRDDRPDMRLVVTFEGMGCRDARVDSLRITFESGGSNNKIIDCASGPFDIIFRDVPTGTVRVFLEGLDQGFVAYSGRFDLQHTERGSHRYDLDLLEATEVVTFFTFAGLGNQDGLFCDEAQITRLNIKVGPLSFNDLPCTSNGVDAASLSGIEPGVYDILVDAFDQAGTRLYASEFRAVKIFQGSNELTLNLLPLVKAGMEFTWEFDDAVDCADAQVANIEWLLVDAAGVEVTRGITPCATATGTASVLFHHQDPKGQLNAGLYALTYVRGISVGGQLRYETTSAPLYAPAGRTQGFIVTLE